MSALHFIAPKHTQAMEAALSNSRDWAVSNFSELERNVSNFLVGKGERGSSHACRH